MAPEEDISLPEKIQALYQVAQYRPTLTIAIVVLGGLTALFEGIGLSFIYPIIEVARSEGPVSGQGRILTTFIWLYKTAGVPLTLPYLIVGIGLVMTLRFSMSFVVGWLRGVLQKSYEATLRSEAFNRSLDAEVSYFDDEGSDNILNAIITETRYSSRVITAGVLSLETLFLAGVYLSIMFYIAPLMAVFALLLLGGITVILRHIIEPAYTVGSRVARANERVQEAVQAGSQGIRDVKLFGLSKEIKEEFSKHLEQYVRSEIDLARNKAALQNLYDLLTSLSLFVLIYIGFVLSGLSLGALGIFLFAMFRLSPLMSRLNSQIYNLEGNLSHLVRTQRFIDRLDERGETGGARSISHVRRIEFDDVHFSYGTNDPVLRGISFAVEEDEFVAFVGQSGAGKSTLVSLLTRMYEPDGGEITANGVPIDEYDIREWRERIAVVRQQPYIFNDTLENNVTIGNRNASRDDVERVCRIAKVDEFLDDLPNGYGSQLGDDGVRLSGGQRQRVALARALLKDADFLVLDEATSDLDSDLEKEVQAGIEAMEDDYGIIAIAHRLSTVQNADLIYTIEKGVITEAGDHQELIEKGGKYAELYSIQSQQS